jgi:hypothetical protein
MLHEHEVQAEFPIVIFAIYNLCERNVISSVPAALLILLSSTTTTTSTTTSFASTAQMGGSRKIHNFSLNPPNTVKPTHIDATSTFRHEQYAFSQFCKLDVKSIVVFRLETFLSASAEFAARSPRSGNTGICLLPPPTLSLG